LGIKNTKVKQKTCRPWSGGLAAVVCSNEAGQSRINNIETEGAKIHTNQVKNVTYCENKSSEIVVKMIIIIML